MKTRPAAEMADMMLDYVLPDLPFAAGDKVAVLLSGLGATPVMELYILYDRLADVLGQKNIEIRHNFVGNYFTSLEMMGATLTVMRLDDELDAPDLERVGDAAAHLERLLEGVRVADGAHLERRRRAHVVDGERRPRAADLGRAREALAVDGEGLRTRRAQLVDDLQEVVVVDEVEVGVLPRPGLPAAVVEAHDDAGPAKRREARAHAHLVACLRVA